MVSHLMSKTLFEYFHVTIEMLRITNSFISYVKPLKRVIEKVYLHRPHLNILQNLMNNLLKTSLAIFDFFAGISKPYFRHLPAQSTSRLMCFTMLFQFQYIYVYLI